MSSSVLRANALHLPLADETVDLIVTSPPYFALRSYRDDGEHYDGQIGSEPTPAAFLESLWAVTRECWRVLKPSGSMFVNLGDKRAGSGGHNNAGVSAHGEKRGPRSYNKAVFGRAKSKMLLPHRYAIGCEDGLADPDGLGWIVRQELVWSKPNGLPESVRDRCRDSHEYWFHLTKQGDYYSAVDELREPQQTAGGFTYTTAERQAIWEAMGPQRGVRFVGHALGRLPGSVWSITAEPLRVPEHVDVEHFAAFPSEWPRRLILGWSPPSICTACGEGRRPAVERHTTGRDNSDPSHSAGYLPTRAQGEWRRMKAENPDRIIGYGCSCNEPIAPTRPAVVLDPFGGTGTVAMVARALGRTGLSVDLSMDYCRLAQWRTTDPGQLGRVETRTHRDRQGVLL